MLWLDVFWEQPEHIHKHNIDIMIKNRQYLLRFTTNPP